MATIYSWGRQNSIEASIYKPSGVKSAQSSIKTGNTLIAYGNGRCYGDSCLQGEIIKTSNLKRVIEFDTYNATFHCESGLLLDEILTYIVPHGFFLPVTSGTKFITIGGAVASNIHGKNHLTAGSFSEYIISLELIDNHGQLHQLTDHEHPLYRETIGGMGLSGLIYSVKFKLKKIESSYLSIRNRKIIGLDRLIKELHQAAMKEYAVAWLDISPNQTRSIKGIISSAKHCKKKELNGMRGIDLLRLHRTKALSIPFYSRLLNKYILKLFNQFRYRTILNDSVYIRHYDSFFYTLDSIRNWNRLYGSRGLLQYQFMIPSKRACEAINSVIKQIQLSDETCYLAVLKVLGPKSKNTSSLSFPREGYTLALDFKATDGAYSLMNTLDEIVLKHSGRIYLTKDARISESTFKLMYPNWNNGSEIIGQKFQSLQSERLMITKNK